jgi:hypothetical protein
MKSRKLKPREDSEILPQKVREYAEKIASDPKLSREFLQRAGIYTRSGKLTKHYR